MMKSVPLGSSKRDDNWRLHHGSDALLSNGFIAVSYRWKPRLTRANDATTEMNSGESEQRNRPNVAANCCLHRDKPEWKALHLSPENARWWRHFEKRVVRDEHRCNRITEGI
jgi:hypothetical protein